MPERAFGGGPRISTPRQGRHESMSAVYKKIVMGPETFAGQLCLIVLLVCRVVLVALFLAGEDGRQTFGRVLALDLG